MIKEKIISELTRSREEILKLLEGISAEEMESPGVLEQWSLKDLLVHLTRWEAELVKLLWQAKQGIQPTTIHFSAEDTDAINERWYQQSRTRSSEIVWKDFLTVREQTLRRVEDFSDRELTDRQYYAWSRDKALWEWIADDSYSHEAEHAEHVRNWKTRLDEAG